jgi:glycosyltransferase involved in cell wall biosynthesis
VRDLASIIVIPGAWGEGVRRSIESAAAQSYGPVEIIVVDTGGHGARARALVIGLGSAPAVRVVERRPPGGARRNAGVAASHGSFIVCVKKGRIRSDFCAGRFRLWRRPVRSAPWRPAS